LLEYEKYGEQIKIHIKNKIIIIMMMMMMNKILGSPMFKPVEPLLVSFVFIFLIKIK
jgi:hypothetical protein